MLEFKIKITLPTIDLIYNKFNHSITELFSSRELEHAERNARPQNPRARFAPFGIGAFNYESHDNVGDTVEATG